MSETIEITVSDETVAQEVAIGIIGRSQDLHDNPNDDLGDIAEELRDTGQDLFEEYNG